MPPAQLQSDLPARYRVLRHIATGGMAAVYAATDERLGREVAIKVLTPALAADDAARERFTREARAAARVGDHPNVVTIFDIGETPGDPPGAFIVMELLTGGTVAERLRAGEPIPHVLALRWLEQTASALDAAHAEGMVHRDVKPANLLLDAQGTLKVADFGIATLATDSPLTQTGQVVGTAAYFSPEQAMGKPATAASDRYALAVLAFELLTGQRPFPPGPPAAQAMARVDSDPPPATSVAPGLPSGVDTVLANGMARDPADRPASASALVAALQEALGPTASTGVAHPVPAPTEKVAPAAVRSPRTPRPAPAAAVSSPPRRNRTAVLAAVAALLLVAGAGLAAILAGDDEAPLDAVRTQQSAEPKTNDRPATTATTPAPAATPEPEPDPDPTAPADATAIQREAHAKIEAGDYNGAIEQLGGLVGRCDVAITDPCAYAWFDLGYALRRAGDPAGAVEALEHRLQNPDQAGTVQAELDAARAELAGAGDEDDSDSPGNGKAKGHKKDKD